jgi:hypothetical protein
MMQNPFVKTNIRYFSTNSLTNIPKLEGRMLGSFFILEKQIYNG